MGAGMRRDGIQAAVLEPGASRARPRATIVRDSAVAEALRALCVSRLLVWASGAAAAALFGLSARVQLFDPGAVTRPFGPAGNALVAPLARWDSVWYLAIANDGYPAEDPRRAAFYPLYPLLLRVAKALVGSPIVAGVAVSLVCFGVALVLLHRVTALELGPAAADEAVWALALFPAAVFFSAVYSEALYLMLAIGAVYAARTGRWAWAGTLGVLGASPRSAGVLLVIPLAIMWLTRADGSARRRVRDAAWVAFVPAGLAAFCAALALGGGDAFAPLHAQDVWFRRFAGPFVGVWDGTAAAWRGLHHLDAPFARADVVLFCFLLLAIPAVAGVLRRLAPGGGGRRRTGPTSSRPSRCRCPIRSTRSRSCRCRASSRSCSRSSCGSAPGWPTAGARGGSRCSRRPPRASSRPRRCSRPGTGSHEGGAPRRARDARGARAPVAAPRRGARRARRDGDRGRRPPGDARRDGVLPRQPRRRERPRRAGGPAQAVRRGRARGARHGASRRRRRGGDARGDPLPPLSGGAGRPGRAARARLRPGRRVELGRLAARRARPDAAARAGRRGRHVGRARRRQARTGDLRPRARAGGRRAGGGGAARG